MTKTSKSLADQLFPIQEEDDEISVIDIPPEKRRLHTESYDFSIATIHDYMNSGTMFVPRFQREYVWSRAQASRLIESLIIQCPIPVIYLNQERDEKLAVIDGNQRITSIKLFLDDEFELQGLTTYPELDGNKFSTLDPRFKRHILNRTLRCITILKETHPQIKVDVFERLNTGAVQLNPQEVRHGIYHGPLIELIDSLTEEPIWKKLSGFKNDNRMKGSELILRYFALLNNQKKYSKPLKSFLNKFCDEHSNLNEKEVLRWKNQFLTAIENVDLIFGTKAFKTLNAELEPLVNSVNGALIDSVLIGFTRVNPSRKKIETLDKTKFIQAFYELINEDKFKESITAGTSATALVNYRISEFYEFLESKMN